MVRVTELIKAGDEHLQFCHRVRQIRLELLSLCLLGDCLIILSDIESTDLDITFDMVSMALNCLNEVRDFVSPALERFIVR